MTSTLYFVTFAPTFEGDVTCVQLLDVKLSSIECSGSAVTVLTSLVFARALAAVSTSRDFLLMHILI